MSQRTHGPTPPAPDLLKRERDHAPGASDFETSPTPKAVIHSRDNLKLYHFLPTHEEVYRVPVLLVMSLVSRVYILDLMKGQSLVEYLVNRGFDVYMIDWGVPRPEHSGFGLERYVLDFLPECAEKVQEHAGEADLTMVGYCMGGLLASMYAALHPQGPLHNLVCFTTPVNAAGMGLFQRWSDPAIFDIDRIVDEVGNIPPELILASLQALRPLQRSAGQLRLLGNADNDAFVQAHLRLDRWAMDQIPFPGETARQLVKGFLRDNKLVRNEFEVGGKRVDFGAIRVPFLHVTAEYDHIVPHASSRDLVGLVGSADKLEITLKGGHVSLVAGGNAVHRLWPKLDAWLSERSV